MCGRYAITSPLEAIIEAFALKGPRPNLQPHYNAAPSQYLPVIRAGRNGRELVPMRWGLVPSWSKGPDARYSMINARAETVASKPAYRGPFRHQRCLVPANGFYEWKAGTDGKQPYFITLTTGEPFAFAGLWDQWMSPDGSEMESFTIIVTAANDVVRPIHDRMPVILGPDTYESWLGEAGAPSRTKLAILLRPYPAERMRAYPVSRAVNSPANDSAELLEPVEAEDQGSLL
ncbi:MAG TPA: SOS response-associated peptidase [Alphaproteobacteria bacterium]|nr:SOS response-associated peptidase [Alphaproteobacteria bacterium]